MRRFARTLAATGLATTLLGCNGNTADLGGGPEGREGGTAGGDGGGPVDAQANPLSGKYMGYIESFTFPDGSDVVTMTLTFAASGAVTGTVFFGSGAPLAPPTDPSVGYPPGWYDSLNDQSTPFEGFDFTALGGTYAAPPRLQLSVQQEEIWKQWCEIQTMIYPVEVNLPSDGGCGTPSGAYSCLPTAETKFGPPCALNGCQEPGWTPIDCGKLQLCRGIAGSICNCTATACTLPIPTPGDVAFDMRLASGSLDGSVTGFDYNAQVYNVHLTKQ